MAYQQIESLDTLMGGAVQEKFNASLTELFANIQDPNTKATAKRSLSMTVTISPNGNRDVAQMDVQCKVKLAPTEPAQTTIYLSYSDNGTVTATEKINQIPGQLDIDGDEAPLPNVVIFEGKK